MREQKDEDKVTEQILSILKEKGSSNYSEIRELLKEKSDSSLPDRILTYNLQKLADLGIIEEEDQSYRYTGELGKGALDDIDSMLERVLSTIFEEYGEAVPNEKLRSIIEERVEELIEEYSQAKETD